MNIHTKCELIVEEKLIMSRYQKETNSFKTWSQGNFLWLETHFGEKRLPITGNYNTCLAHTFQA